MTRTRRASTKLPRLSRPEMRAQEAVQETLAARLSSLIGMELTVKLNRNRRLLVQLGKDRKRKPVLRMHVALADVGGDELSTLAAWVKGQPGSAGAVRTLVDRRQAAIDQVTSLRLPPGRTLAMKGRKPRVHDIVLMVQRMRATCFPALGEIHVAWSGRPGASRRMRLGWYDPTRKLVSIHECLDSPDVPAFFVESVVHHELCHAAIDKPSLTLTGRRRVHGPEFRLLERRFLDLDRALAWERTHLGAVLAERQRLAVRSRRRR